MARLETAQTAFTAAPEQARFVFEEWHRRITARSGAGASSSEMSSMRVSLLGRKGRARSSNLATGSSRFSVGPIPAATVDDMETPGLHPQSRSGQPQEAEDRAIGLGVR